MSEPEAPAPPAHLRGAGEDEGARLVTTADGVPISICWHPAPHPATGPATGRGTVPAGEAATVVVVHGFSAHRREANVRLLVSALGDAGYDVLAYDSRGHGDSGGQCEIGGAEAHDVAAVVDAAISASPRAPIVLLGVSMGAVAVLRYLDGAFEPAVRGAVLVSAPARWAMRPSAFGLLLAGLTKTPVGRWASARWLGVRVARKWTPGEPPAETAARLSVPVAVVHGAEDALLRREHASQLAAAAGAGARLTVVEGMRHGLTTAATAPLLDAVGWVLLPRS